MYACIKAPTGDQIYYYMPYSDVCQLLGRVVGWTMLTNIRLGSEDKPRRPSNVVLRLRRSSLPPLRPDWYRILGVLSERAVFAR